LSAYATDPTLTSWGIPMIEGGEFRRSPSLVQVADFYASSAAAALEPNAYGIGEESYLLAVKDHLYRGQGGIFSTGFKIFPDSGRDAVRYPWLGQLLP
jgi:hypothetical protein